jgi:mannose-6-phosphate isomerase-like protein (cupin superfamily)
MKTLHEDELHRQLHAEGFRRTYTWQDGPNAFYPEHTHPTETAHIVLDGEIAITMNGAMRVYRVGERCDVPAGAEHCARIGPQGCRYLIGER